MKALVVDDSAVMRKVLTGALARANITEVEQAADGQEALDACNANDFDLVLMDWNMPVMLGIDAVKGIREAGKTMPIIMVTTKGLETDRIWGMRQGAIDYIVKPFADTELVAMARSVLEK